MYRLEVIAYSFLGVAMNYKIWGGVVSATILIGSNLALCFVVSSEWSDRTISLAVIGTAVAIGWLVGVVISPYDPKEQKQFSQYAKAVAAFGSGYLAAKMDKLIEKVLSPALLSEAVSGFRFLSFVSVLIVCILITFIFRNYAD